MKSVDHHHHQIREGEEEQNKNNVPNTEKHWKKIYSCKFCFVFYYSKIWTKRAILYSKNYHNEKISIYECKYCQYASQYSGKVERYTLLRVLIEYNVIK